MTLRRVVFDTGTLVSAALRPHSVPFQALHSALRFCDVCASGQTLSELKTVLTRAKLRRYLASDLRQQFVEMIDNRVRLFAVRNQEFRADRLACRDPNDNQFLALAFECEATVIVSSDDDLLVLDPWGETRILRPADFLHELK